MTTIKCKATVEFEALFEVPVPDDMSSYNGIDDLLGRAEEEATDTLPDIIGDGYLDWHINWDTLRFYEMKGGN